MKTKPWIFNLLALLNLVLIFWIPAQIFWMNGISKMQISDLPKFLNLTNMILIGLFSLCTYFLIRPNRLTPVVIISTCLLVIFNNQLAQANNSYAPWIFDLASICYLLTILPAFLGKNYRAMVDQHFQWWKTDPRYQAKIKVLVYKPGETIEAQSMDISSSGIFLQKIFDETVEGEEVTIQLELENGHRVFCKAQVVRKTEAKGHYPRGVGLKFTNQPYFFRKHLGQFIKAQQLF